MGTVVPERILKDLAGLWGGFPNYAAGTWGPAASDAMLARRGHLWRKP